jgi:transposase
MDTSTRSASKPIRRRRRLRTIQEKRHIVEQALQAGESVATVARRHEVNANQVFAWRRLYEQGLLEPNSTALLPVAIITSKQAKRVHPPTDIPSAASDDYVEVEFVGGDRLRARGRLATQLLDRLVSRFGSR